MVVTGTTRLTAATLTFGLAALLVVNIAKAESPQASEQMDTAPGPAYAMVDGKVTKIDGDVYTVESGGAAYLDSGIKPTEMRIYVGQQTQKIRGEKKVGDKIRAEVTRGGFANFIQ
ncbi:MAG: hypothetical protein KF814_03755 [Nitrospiraceae bacterium]|nr:hypothetical protein [Nitrospiraceae bacterium]